MPDVPWAAPECATPIADRIIVRVNVPEETYDASAARAHAMKAIPLFKR